MVVVVAAVVEVVDLSGSSSGLCCEVDDSDVRAVVSRESVGYRVVLLLVLLVLLVYLLLLVVVVLCGRSNGVGGE